MPLPLSRRSLWSAVAAGLLLRILLILLIRYPFDRGDAAEYDRYACNLVEHHGFSFDAAPPYTPSVVRPPGYPLFLAGVYSLFGKRNFLAVELVQLLLNLLGAGILACAVARVRRDLATIFLWVVMLSPWDGAYTVAVLAEAPSTFFLMLGISSPILLAGRRGWFASGLALAGAILCRDVYLALVPLVTFGVLFGVRERFLLAPRLPLRERGLRAALFVVGAALVISPWTVRNRLVTGKTIVTSQGILGQALWTGSWEVNGDWFSPRWETDLSPDCCRTPEELREAHAAFKLPMGPERERRLMRLALARYRSEPHRVLGRWLLRAPRLWRGSRLDIFSFRPTWLQPGRLTWILIKSALLIANVSGALLGTIGIFFALRRRDPLLWFSVPVLYTVFIFFPLHSTEVRYSTPAFSFMLLFAISTAFVWTKRTGGQAQAGGAGAADAVGGDALSG